MTRKRISIFGATGSVGQSTLSLVQAAPPGTFEVVALTAHRDVAALAAAARATDARLAVIGDAALTSALADALAGTRTQVAGGTQAIIEAAAHDVDWTMAAIVGCAGLRPTMRAIADGGTVALANKESLVSAGALMIDAARRSGATILPVDSEHNAVFQSLAGNSLTDVEHITLTASGGPFRECSTDDMRAVTPAQAVKHPNWSMGAKISVDSATMMNKGLELIEAHWLFAMPSERLRVLIHPQSVVHSLVSYRDGSVIAQLGCADMRVPIASALAWPARMATDVARLDLAAVGRLDFADPDLDRFPALRLAREAMEAGGARPAILNAANEVAVAAFLAGRIGFLDIAGCVASVLDRFDPPAPASIDETLDIDGRTRHLTAQVVEELAR